MLKQAIRHALAQRKDREEGQGLVEYALILVLVAVVVIVILSQLGTTIDNVFSDINDALGGNIVVSNGGNEPDPKPAENCVDMVFGLHVKVRADGRIDQGTPHFAASDPTCEGAGVGTFGKDSVYIPGGGSSTQADNLCQTHFGKNQEQPIWIGTSTEFWYCI